MCSRHVGSVAAHRRFAATFASARPPCRLSDQHISSDSISAVQQTKPTVQGNNSQAKTTPQAEQAGAFFSSESGEKKRTGRVGLSVSLKNLRNANPNGWVGLSVT